MGTVYHGNPGCCEFNKGDLVDGKGRPNCISKETSAYGCRNGISASNRPGGSHDAGSAYSAEDRSSKTIIDTVKKRELTMNLSDLIAKLAENENLTHREAESAVKLIFRLFTDAMKEGDRIEIRGFGSFEMREYGSYAGRNPKTGMQIEVKPKSSTYFKVGKELRERINGTDTLK